MYTAHHSSAEPLYKGLVRSRVTGYRRRRWGSTPLGPCLRAATCPASRKARCRRQPSNSVPIALSRLQLMESSLTRAGTFAHAAAPPRGVGTTRTTPAPAMVDVTAACTALVSARVSCVAHARSTQLHSNFLPCVPPASCVTPTAYVDPLAPLPRACALFPACRRAVATREKTSPDGLSIVRSSLCALTELCACVTYVSACGESDSVCVCVIAFYV